MKKIVLYTRRNVGLAALSFLVAKGYSVKVITDDESIIWLAKSLGCKIVTIEKMGRFDLFLCVHGNRIIDKKYLVDGKFVNIHPCLFKYKGHNPIKRFILNEDTDGTVESQYLIEEVDGGDVIHKESFHTGHVLDYAGFYNIAFKFYLRCIDATLKKLKL